MGLAEELVALALPLIEARADGLMQERHAADVAAGRSTLVIDAMSWIVRQLEAELATPEARELVANALRTVSATVVAKYLQPDPETGTWAG